MFSPDVLRIDAERVADDITHFIRGSIVDVLRRRGAVLGLSGGVDSSVVAALCARALGPERTLGLLMPERDSSSDSTRLGQLLADRIGIPTLIEDIGPTLAAIGCYSRQEHAVRQVFPDFQPDYTFKLVLPSLLEGDRLSVSRLVIESPTGERRSSRMSGAGYRELVAATNFKQRVRKMLEYHHADRLGFAVAGTPNRLEYDQGFFVKQGDGAADIKPIAHLYKTQVYALAAYLGVPEEIRRRPPTTDTFSMAQTQEEFYFSLPYDKMDLCLWAVDHGVSAADAAPAVGISPAQVERVFADIDQKRRATRYQHAAPLMLEAQPVR
jgi:NAD+ synthase